MVIVGVHPYDIVALVHMDEIFRETKSDPYYFKKRDASIIIGVNIQRMSKWNFSAYMGCAVIDYGYDLMLTDLGNRYAITVGSQKGGELLSKYAENVTAALARDIQVAGQKKRDIMNMSQQKFDFQPELSYYNLNSVSRTLSNQIWDGIKHDPHIRTVIQSEGQIIHHLPREPHGAAHISVFLYHISEIPSMRNQPQPQHGTRTLLNLKLRYLIAPSTFNAENDQVVLGRIMQIFAEKPVLRAPELQGSLREDGDELHIALDPLAADDLGKLWAMFTLPYKLSVSYSVFPVHIDSAKKPLRRPNITQQPNPKPQLELKGTLHPTETRKPL